MSIETKVRIIKLIQENNPEWSGVKDVGYLQPLVYIIWCEYKLNGWLKKENKQKTAKRRDRKLNQHALKIENIQQNKWKINGSKQELMFVTELLEIHWMRLDSHKKIERKPETNTQTEKKPWV